MYYVLQNKINFDYNSYQSNPMSFSFNMKKAGSNVHFLNNERVAVWNSLNRPLSNIHQFYLPYLQIVFALRRKLNQRLSGNVQRLSTI